jgi:hypothetical protein
MFNLEDYEDVATLNRWFIENFPMGRSNLITEMHDPDKGYIRVKAEIYRDITDLNPAVTNVAFGARDLYNRNMARYYVEDTFTSALGRAIILLKGSNKTATRESMEQVSAGVEEVAKAKAKMLETSGTYIPVVKEEDPWTIKPATMPPTMGEAVSTVKEIIGGQTEKDIPHCKHGEMMWKTGTTKAGKPWGHMKCKAAVTGEIGGRCESPNDVIWYEIAKDGSWQRQKARM